MMLYGGSDSTYIKQLTYDMQSDKSATAIFAS